MIRENRVGRFRLVLIAFLPFGRFSSSPDEFHARPKSLFMLKIGWYAHGHFWNILTALLLAVWTQLILFGTGGNEMTDFALGTDYVSAVQSGLLLFITLLWLVSTRIGKWLAAALVLILVGISPLYLVIGGALVTAQNIDTLIATDTAESLSFLRTVPLQHFIEMPRGNLRL